MSAVFALNDVLGIPIAVSMDKSKCLVRPWGQEWTNLKESKIDISSKNAIILYMQIALC